MGSHPNRHLVKKVSLLDRGKLESRLYKGEAKPNDLVRESFQIRQRKHSVTHFMTFIV